MERNYDNEQATGRNTHRRIWLALAFLLLGKKIVTFMAFPDDEENQSLFSFCNFFLSRRSWRLHVHSLKLVMDGEGWKDGD